MPRVTIRVMGNFQVLDRTGRDVTPRARKSCALLALLALTAGHKRSRVWVKDKLWSDRGAQQAAASLRTALTDIRRSLGADADILVSDRFTIGLDPDGVDVDRGGAGLGGFELLEGLDVRDQEFNDWLTSERLRSISEIAQHPTCAVATPSLTRRVGDERNGRFCLVLQPGRASSERSAIIADILADTVAQSISEIISCDVLDLRHTMVGLNSLEPRSLSELVFSVQSDFEIMPTGSLFRLTLQDENSHTLISSSRLPKRDRKSIDVNSPDILSCVNYVVDCALQALVQNEVSAHPSTLAAVECYGGIRDIFRLDTESLERADRRFKKAYDLEPRGVYLAWSAFQRTFVLAERRFNCRQTLEEEAIDLIRRAQKLEPSNSLVCGIAAHVYTLFQRSYDVAHELASRAIKLNAANPLALACLGVAESHRGNTEIGFEYTRRAKQAASHTPFFYQINALHCIAGTIGGRYNEAIAAAEMSHALEERFAPPLRYLSALYLWKGDEQRSQTAVAKLRQLEPDFDYPVLRDPSYPSGGLQRSGLLALLPGRDV